MDFSRPALCSFSSLSPTSPEGPFKSQKFYLPDSSLSHVVPCYVILLESYDGDSLSRSVWLSHKTPQHKPFFRALATVLLSPRESPAPTEVELVAYSTYSLVRASQVDKGASGERYLAAVIQE